MANEKPSTQTQPHGDAATRKKTETSVAEAGSSAEKHDFLIPAIFA